MDNTELGLLLSSIGFIGLVGIIYAVLPEYKVSTLQHNINKLENSKVPRHQKEEIIKKIQKRPAKNLYPWTFRTLTKNNAKKMLNNPNTPPNIVKMIRHIWSNL